MPVSSHETWPPMTNLAMEEKGKKESIPYLISDPHNDNAVCGILGATTKAKNNELDAQRCVFFFIFCFRLFFVFSLFLMCLFSLFLSTKLRVASCWFSILSVWGETIILCLGHRLKHVNPLKMT